MRELSAQEQKEIRDAVAAGVRDVLLEIGIDVSSPRGVQETQQDMHFLRRYRKTAEASRRWVVLTAIGTIVAGALSLIWMGLRPQ